MQGSLAIPGAEQHADAQGLCSRAFASITAALAGPQGCVPWVCRCSAVEVYNDTSIDLLAAPAKAMLSLRDLPSELEAASSGVCVCVCVCVFAASPEAKESRHVAKQRPVPQIHLSLTPTP